MDKNGKKISFDLDISLHNAKHNLGHLALLRGQIDSLIRGQRELVKLIPWIQNFMENVDYDQKEKMRLVDKIRDNQQDMVLSLDDVSRILNIVVHESDDLDDAIDSFKAKFDSQAKPDSQ